jgi:Protein of unknown function (DUF3553)
MGLSSNISVMRFLRHPMKTEWGVGVVVSEDASNVDVLFEGVGYRKMAKSFKGLVEVSESDVAQDHPVRNQEGWPKVARDGKRADAKRELPKRFDGFIKEFLSAFPDGLRSKMCDDQERNYKVEASEFARKELSPDVLEQLLAKGEYREIITRTHRCLAKVNLAFPNELVRFKGVPESAHRRVAECIVGLVKAGEDTPAALEELASVLEPHGAAKWPIVSLLPFLLDPERWPFVKPTSVKLAAAATDFDVEYSPRPNARTYELIRDLHEHVGKIMRERELEPRDLIDVQTFLWVASGMRRALLEKREREDLE